MAQFSYVRARDLAEALELLGEPGKVSKPLAGGTDLLVMTRQGPPPCDRLVDISRLAELKCIERRGDEIVIGAGVSFAEAAASPLLKEAAACLAEACSTVGSPQIRNAGTLGGNVINAAPCADSLPVLVCLDAVAHLHSTAGERTLPVASLVQGPHQSDVRPGELLTSFRFPALPPGTRSAFIKLGRRNAQAISRLSMASLGHLAPDGRVDLVRLVPGAATPQTTRLAGVENLLLGKQPDEDLLTAAGQRTADLMVAITGRRWSTTYKEPAVRALAERALRRVLLD
jgi:CO/xanthine dehydrogenase FAD-binding subunit